MIHGVAPEHASDRADRVGWVDTRALPRCDGRACPIGPGLEGDALDGHVGPARTREHAAAEPGDKPLERRTGVGDEAERDGSRYTDVARVDVDMDHSATRRVAPVLVEGHIEVADTRTHDEHDVGIAPQFVGRGTLRMEVERMIVRHHGAPGHRGDHRAAQQFREFDQRCVCARAVYPGAREDHRTARSGK